MSETTGTRRVLPYGSWPSPFSAAEVAQAGVRAGEVAISSDGAVWWSESRPAEGGRNVLVRKPPSGPAEDVLPADVNVRTRAHEYGGGAWLALPDQVIYANWADQRLYRYNVATRATTALTAEPAEPMGDRYADVVPLSAGGDAVSRVVAVRERSRAGEISRSLVSITLDGSDAAREPHELHGGTHFVSSPAVSPDGRLLAFLTWEHPQMPWDGTRLHLLELATGAIRILAGGTEESLVQPAWTPGGELLVISDRSGWWNLYRVDLSAGASAVLHPLCPRDEEFAGPQWTFGTSWFAVIDDRRLLCQHGNRLAVLDRPSGELTDLELPFTAFGTTLRVRGNTAVVVAAHASALPQVVAIDIASAAVTVLRPAAPPPTGWSSVPRHVTVPVADPEKPNRVTHAWLFPPTGVDVAGPETELPPWIVFVHGGPTGATIPSFSATVAYFTSRGIGVADVDYGGSTGYGRAYRNSLLGRWGEVDVEDCAAVAQWLGTQGLADPARVAIRGGSAGGWTVLCALTRTDVFHAGASHFGVADAVALAAHTHDFESRYLDGLIAPLPAGRARYDELSPLSHTDGLSCPVLLLQGLEDPIVPPAQAEAFAAALERAHMPYAYLAFPGEQHGWRRAETITAALEAELSFYGQVFGFDPPGIPRLELKRP